MKNIFKIFIVAVMITGLWSCESEDNFMLVEAPAASFSIITPGSGSQIVLTKDMPQANNALTLTWENVDYGTPTVVNYTVQFAVNGTEFADPVDISSATTTNFSMTVADLNQAALDLDLTPEVEGGIDVRIKATVGTTGSEEKYSDVITILVTPFPSNIMRQLFLVGDASPAGWDNTAGNANFTPMFRDPANINVFYYTGRLVPGGFKLIEVRGQWAPMWGLDGGTVTERPTEADPDVATHTITADGYYSVRVDLASMTYTVDEYTGDTSVNWPTIGLIGDSTPGGWDNSTPMTQNAFDPHIWTSRADLTTAGLKFRANNAWDVSWGSDTPLSGVGSTAGGSPNIPVEAGQYDIWFNDLDGRYILIPVE